MKIHVSTHMTIAALQQIFSECFPCLALSFFSKPHDIYQSSPVKYLITECNTRLEHIEAQPRNADIEISPDMKVSELEQLLEREFGLHVQVLRKEGSSWAETTFTDNLTLREQNAKASTANDHDFHMALLSDYHDARTEWYLG
ncbi:MAG: hypothetical protein Q7T20_09125 [Saprospiraceae bacterium]|nr:hypothetical protein [Saprospiraceae bacterium]